MTITLTHHRSTRDTSAHDTSVHRGAIAARAVDAPRCTARGEGVRRSTASPSTSRPGTSPRSWAHRAPASRRLCTRSPDSIAHVRLRTTRRRGLGRLKEKKLTKLRRDRIGFIFQAFNLMPTLTAAENIILPMRLAGRKPDQDWLDHVVDTVGLRNPAQPPSIGAVGRAAAAGRGCTGARRVSRTSSSPTSQPAISTLDGRRDPFVHASGRRELGQTIVMVTHDPVAAAYADRACSSPTDASSMTCPADGRRVFDRMRTFGA